MRAKYNLTPKQTQRIYEKGDFYMERALRVTKETAEVISELCSLLGIKHDIEKDSSSSARIITLDYDFMEVDKRLKRNAGRKGNVIDIEALKAEVKQKGVTRTAADHGVTERTIYRQLKAQS